MKQKQQEGRKEEEEISEEGLTQSLQKRDQNIQENKAMVGFPLTLSLSFFICPVGIRGCLTACFCCCVLVGQAFCRSEYHHWPAEVLHPSGWSTFSHHMKWWTSCLPNYALPLQKKSEKATPRKRKFESEVGSERRNPSRKARPPENFAVEEKSESRPCKSPKIVDVETLLKVRVWDPHLL